jgi:hypothetical protein
MYTIAEYGAGKILSQVRQNIENIQIQNQLTALLVGAEHDQRLEKRWLGFSVAGSTIHLFGVASLSQPPSTTSISTTSHNTTLSSGGSETPILPHTLIPAKLF